MKKLFLLLTTIFTLSSFISNVEDTNLANTEFEDLAVCNYSIFTMNGDGSVTRDDYTTTAYNNEHCQYIANNHAALIALLGN